MKHKLKWRVRWLILFVVFVAAFGCSKGNSVVGHWSLNGPLGLMQVEFKPDGTYGGKYMGAGIPADMSGTYKIEGKALHMDAPTISAMGNSTTLGGGTMKMSMDWKSKDMVLLDNGSQKLTMTRSGPAPK